jgi:predicted dienelactone hydrolase
MWLKLRILPALPYVFALLTPSAAAVAANPYRLTTTGVHATQSPTSHGVVSMAANWFDPERGRVVPVRIYYPVESDRLWPTIIFSTGLGRSRDDCSYLGWHWASCGYVAVHVQHPGSDIAVRRQTLRPRKELEKSLFAPDNIRNRPLDLIFVIDQLERLQRAGHAPANRCDLNRIGAAGHDFGAQSAMALAGEVLPGHLSFCEPRVKAILAMSSPVPLGQVPLELAFGEIAVPCLHITGTADNSIVGTTTASQRRLPFDYINGADQYLITLFGADHRTCSGHVLTARAHHDAAFHRLIAATSTVFWDAYLNGAPAARKWLAGGGLTAYIGDAGCAEEKLTGE